MALTVSNRCVEDAQAETGKAVRRRESYTSKEMGHFNINIEMWAY
jgi:hypothetical protein